MALKGVKVIEMLGLAPGPFCGMILAEFGATVTVVDKITPATIDVLGNGKSNLALNLKSEKGVKIFRDFCKSSDVLIEPFRPGVMEKIGLGPDVLLKDNPRLIYARLTGYGQNGILSKKAGHDINYVSISGILSLLGRKESNPLPPINIAADFAGGGLMCALGIVMALYERTLSNKGQILDSSMVEGTAYASSWIFRSQNLPIWGESRGKNILDGGAHFYDTYLTKDGKYMSVGAIEPQFYKRFLEGLNLTEDEMSQFSDFDKNKNILRDIFIKRTQLEWCNIFDELDACVTPILSLDDAPVHPHNKFRSTFTVDYNGQLAPEPSPRMSRTPAASLAALRPSFHGEHTENILRSLNYSPVEIKKLHKQGIVFVHPKSKL